MGAQEKFSPVTDKIDLNFKSYFDSLNRNWQRDAKLIPENSCFYVTFKVDSDGKTRDFEFAEVPGSAAPESLKTLIKSMIKTTDGKWTLSQSSLNKEEVVC
jgi:hypothetical protein